jgi:hypothetical protein
MDVDTLEQWLWQAACEIRGPVDAAGFRGKRLSDGVHKKARRWP